MCSLEQTIRAAAEQKKCMYEITYKWEIAVHKQRLAWFLSVSGQMFSFHHSKLNAIETNQKKNTNGNNNKMLKGTHDYFWNQ